MTDLLLYFKLLHSISQTILKALFNNTLQEQNQQIHLQHIFKT